MAIALQVIEILIIGTLYQWSDTHHTLTVTTKETHTHTHCVTMELELANRHTVIKKVTLIVGTFEQWRLHSSEGTL